MFKVRIDRKGYDKFNGTLGFVEFENGVSVRPLTEREVAVIGASIRLVRVDTDEQVGQGVKIKEGTKASAEVKKPLAKASDAKPVEAKPLKYDKDKLEEIASEGGIKAIREIAKEFDVKGVEISKMIDGILEAQAPKTESTE